MDLNEQVPVPCPECGDSQFRLPDSFDDDTLLECATCGFTATAGDPTEHGLHIAEERAMEWAEGELKRIIKKHWP